MREISVADIVRYTPLEIKIMGCQVVLHEGSGIVLEMTGKWAECLWDGRIYSIPLGILKMTAEEEG